MAAAPRGKSITSRPTALAAQLAEQGLPYAERSDPSRLTGNCSLQSQHREVGVRSRSEHIELALLALSELITSDYTAIWERVLC